jgi:hypothetical protein
MTSSLITACEWYRQYLKNNIINYWPLIRSALKDIKQSSNNPSKKDFAITISFVHEVARQLLTEEKDVALCEIVDELVNAKNFKPELDEDRIVPNQLVLTVIGWLRRSRHLCIFRAGLIMKSPPLRSTIGAMSRQAADQGHLHEFGISYRLLESEKLQRARPRI